MTSRPAPCHALSHRLALREPLTHSLTLYTMHKQRDTPEGRMSWLVLLVLFSGLDTAEILIDVTAQLGSDLHLPVDDACQFNGSYHYDLFNSKHNRIGVYDKVDLTPMIGYKNRLTYNHDTWILTLKNLTAQDGTKFTVTLKKNINSKSTPHHIQYQIIINEFPSQNTSQISTDGLLGFALLCVSLDMTVNALFPMVLGKISNFCRWKLNGDWVNFGYQINSCFTFTFQTFSVISLYRGNSYGWLLLLAPIILLIPTLIGLLKCFGRLSERVSKVLQICDINNKPALTVWSFIMLAIQISFPAIILLLYYKFDDYFLTFLGKFWYWLCISVLVSFAWKTGVFFCAYCYKDKRQRQSSFAPINGHKNNGPQIAPGDPEGNGEAQELVQLELQKVDAQH
ncbi:uncharacterized protein LOC130310531 isoform X2 [Hyla sarda]|uniref:uncharacterized protein LOC130310531 isoform X2 n=1 Tax=Hyla sarda TaxID=327740 RepID=UPI0024C463B3|nr:uncharacterized protein LOC130310531 isoform X2 [Hyla sarda]